MSIVAVRFATDDDLLEIEPTLGTIFPVPWERYHGLAMEQIERSLRTKRATAEPFEIGRVGLRSRQHLRRAAAAWALHFMFFSADAAASPGWYLDKAAHYRRWASEIVDAESIALDYDSDNDGTVTKAEEQRPYPAVILRG